MDLLFGWLMPSSATVEHLLEICFVCCISNVLPTWWLPVFTFSLFCQCLNFVSSFLIFKDDSKQNFLCVWATWMVVPLICLFFLFFVATTSTHRLAHRQKRFCIDLNILSRLKRFWITFDYFVCFVIDLCRSVFRLCRNKQNAERKENWKKRRKEQKREW